jgi:hypothetical protein
MITIHRQGICRFTICVGPWAIKLARGATGRRCNVCEAARWKGETPTRREMLCPVLRILPFGVGLIMQRAEPLSEEDFAHLVAVDEFPKWDYVPPDESCPFEYKASDWGRLPDGRLVALDYSTDALSDPTELEMAIQKALQSPR